MEVYYEKSSNDIVINDRRVSTSAMALVLLQLYMYKVLVKLQKKYYI